MDKTIVPLNILYIYILYTLLKFTILFIKLVISYDMSSSKWSRYTRLLTWIQGQCELQHGAPAGCSGPDRCETARCG